MSWGFVDGKETCFIDDKTIEEFLEGHSSWSKEIRDNIIDATRNFNTRVQAFLKAEVMNKFSEMPVKFYSYRVEFQARGSPHILGVLWLDLEKIVEREVSNGDSRFEYLQSALKTIGENNIPDDNEREAVAAYCELFVSCSLRSPEVKKTVEEVNMHHHTKSCKERHLLQILLPKISFSSDITGSTTAIGN